MRRRSALAHGPGGAWSRGKRLGKTRQVRRLDESGFNAMTMVVTLIAVLISVIIGFALFSTLNSSVGNVNDTADYPTGSPVPGLVNLAPLFWVLGIVIAAVAIVFVALKAGLGGGEASPSSPASS